MVPSRAVGVMAETVGAAVETEAPAKPATTNHKRMYGRNMFAKEGCSSQKKLHVGGGVGN